MTIEHQTDRQTGTRHDTASMLDRITAAGAILQNPVEIENFLFDHPTLQTVLPGVVQEASHRLGLDGELVLEVDLSAGFGNEYLVLLLRSRAYDASILELSRDLTTTARAHMAVPDRRFIVTTDFARLS